MAPPARSSARRRAQTETAEDEPSTQAQTDNEEVNRQLFIDPMLGTPLAVYIEKDVPNKDELVRLVTTYGGTVSPGYSGVTYILVDPHKNSGQNLFRQYVGKKGKVVLDARWIHECIKANQLQTFQSNWADCKVTGEEQVFPSSPTRRQEESISAPPPATSAPTAPASQPPPAALPHPIPPIPTAIVDPMNPYPFAVYPHPMHGGPPPPQGMPPAPPQTWHSPAGLAPAPPLQIIHHRPPPSQHYRDDGWHAYHPPDGLPPPPPPFDYRYRDGHPSWAPAPGSYYDPTYDHGYGPSASYIPDPTATNSNAPTGPPASTTVAGSSTSAGTTEPADKPRGRKRTRVNPMPATPAASLVNRQAPARSPTPPSRVIKSTYGGNLFTADDVIYLKKYIDYCQEQGLVLSLREICERVAVKAPHHTFYSWRRYCNKHQIRLGGYMMNGGRGESPPMDEEMGMDIEEEGDVLRGGPGPSTSRINAAAARADPVIARTRSPTPPRALFRSTTGKGVAFTQEDVNFLVRFMRYRESQGRLDMVAFWKDVASKAPHHSRASWMKFWRRHRHELDRDEGDEPLPVPPDKKMRYSREDDILLAKYFYTKPDGTSDKMFQAFGRMNPHHPWKGWQEHHRIHKTKIDHLVELLNMGREIDNEG